METINNNLNTKTPEILSSNIETITLKTDTDATFFLFSSLKDAIFKILLFTVILFLGYNIYSYMFNKIDVVKNLFEGKSIFRKEKKSKKSLEEESVDELKENPSKSIKKSINKKNKNKKVKSSQDKHSFCYIGKDNHKRACAKINDYTKCESNKIFPTLDLCINPNLK